MYNSYSSYSRAVDLSEVFSIISIIMAIAATVLAFIFIIPARKRDRLPKFLQIVHDVFNFNGLVIEVILKALYIISTLYVFLYSFFMLFTGISPFGCLITMVLGPIVVRILFELIMMVILLVKNVIAINSKLKYDDVKKGPESFEFDYTKYSESKKTGKPGTDAQNVTINSGKVCPNCGSIVNADATFCNGCGSQINF